MKKTQRYIKTKEAEKLKEEIEMLEQNDANHSIITSKRIKYENMIMRLNHQSPEIESSIQIYK